MVRSMALECSVWRPHSLHTAEATGSKPVTPTSENASQAHSNGPFARRFARRPRARVASTSVSVACPEPRRANEQLGRRAVDSVCRLSEHPVTPAELSWGVIASATWRVSVNRLSSAQDDSVGHLRGGVPVAGADPAATLQLPMATALVTHELIDDPRRNAFVLKPGRKAVAKIVGSTKLQMCQVGSGPVGCVLIEAAKAVARQDRPGANGHPVAATGTGKDQSVQEAPGLALGMGVVRPGEKGDQRLRRRLSATASFRLAYRTPAEVAATWRPDPEMLQTSAT